MPLKETDTNKAVRPSRKGKDGKENADPKSKPAVPRPRSRKRKVSDENEKENDNAGNAASHVPSVKEDECFIIEYDCDEIRDKIRQYLEHDKVKIADFQKKLRVTPVVYRSFMGQLKGPGNGLKNRTYAAAHQLFLQQESGSQNSKPSTSKKRKIEGNSDDSKKQRIDRKDITSKSKDSDGIKTEDLPKLDGEGDGSVLVYDTCNDVRTKIDAHLRKYKLTKVALAKEISKCQAIGETPVTPEQLTNFQRKNGPLAGNSTKAFYAAYVYFEKLRLKEGKDKTKKRKEMEDVHGERGVMTERAIETIHFKLPRGRKVWVDKYGHPRNSAGTW